MRRKNVWIELSVQSFTPRDSNAPLGNSEEIQELALILLSFLLFLHHSVSASLRVRSEKWWKLRWCNADNCSSQIPDREETDADEGGFARKGKAGEQVERVVPQAAGEKAFIARCTILRVLNSFAGIIPKIGNGSQEYCQVLAIL